MLVKKSAIDLPINLKKSTILVRPFTKSVNAPFNLAILPVIAPNAAAN